MEEIWKDIKGFEGYYQVSNLGRVKSLFRVILKSNGVKHPVKEIIRKPATSKKGYCEVYLRHKNSHHTLKIHRLVMSHFVKISNLEVNHKDGDKTNNTLSNLEYVTTLQNMNHRETSLKCKTKYGVYFNKGVRKWMSQIKYKNKRIYLGIYLDKEDAYDIFYLMYYFLYKVAPW